MTVALALGANAGARRSTLRWAVERLSALLDAPRCGPLFETLPIGGPPQPPFLNTALVGRTALPAGDLLAVCKRLEVVAGRRRGPRHGPRPLDIDLLLWGDLRLEHPELTLPHPELRRRRFYLAPLAELAPDLEVPPDGRSVAELLAAVGQEGSVRRVAWR